MKKVLNRNNLIFILILMTLFGLMMPTVSYAANVSINDMLKETVAGWYDVFRALSIGFMIILFLVVVIKAAATRDTSSDASTQLKEMLGYWLIMFFLIIRIDFFMISAVNLNESIVSAAEDLGKSLSGMEQGQEMSLYESTISKAYEVRFKPGTIGMILYMMLVYYTYKFVFVYFKRYINVIVLIITAPIVCCYSAYRKVILGKSTIFIRWVKEFIYNVFLQSLHALMYGTLVGLTLKYSNETESFVGAIITMILFAVIFKVDKLVRKLFNRIGGSSEVAVSAIDSIAGNAVSSTGKVLKSKAMVGGASAVLGEDSKVVGKMKNHFGNNLKFETVTKGIKTDSRNAWVAFQNEYKQNEKYLKDTFSDVSGTIRGDYKEVSAEQLEKAKEQLENPNSLRKLKNTVQGVVMFVPNTVKKTGELIDKVKQKTEEVKKYLENKKRDVITYVNELKKDVETIKSIPKLIKNIRKLPSIVKNDMSRVKRNIQAIFDLDRLPSELESRLKETIRMSMRDITAAVLMAVGFEIVYRCPTIAMNMLAEQNYKDMVHPEIPMESRRMIKGVKNVGATRYQFEDFDIGCIKKLESITMSSFIQNFAGLKALSKVAVGVRNQTITFKSVVPGTEDGVISWKGSIKKREEAQRDMTILLEGVHNLKNDAQMAINVNLLSQMNQISQRIELTNITPEMLKALEIAGMVQRIEEDGKVTGYIFFNDKIKNAGMEQNINLFLAENQNSLLAHKVNQFLEQNPDSEIALRISNYVIDNPESVLAQVVNNIVITEDGKILQKVQGFSMAGEQPRLAQLGVLQEDKIVQKIITEDGKIVEQIIDMQGNIVQPAVDENGEIIKFPVNENGVMIQNIISPEGTIVQQVLSQDGLIVKPIIFQTLPESTVSLENINGVINQITPEDGVIKVINSETGEVEIFKPESGTMQIVKDEDGNIKLIVSQPGEEETRVVFLPENAMIQVIKPEDSMIQVIDLEQNTVQTLIDIPNVKIEKTIPEEPGIITQIETLEQGTIKLVSADGSVQEIRTENAQIQVVKDEDGTIKLIVSKEGEKDPQIIVVPEDSKLEVIKPQEFKTEVIDLQQNMIQTTINLNNTRIETPLSIKEDGVITQVAPLQGSIRIVNADGNVQEIKPDDTTIEIRKDENGAVQLVNTVTKEVISIPNDAVVTILQPEDGMVQVINFEKNTIETALGETAIQVLNKQGVELTSEEVKDFTRKQDVKRDIMQIAYGGAVDLATGEIENVYGIQGQTEILTSLVEDEIVQVTPSEENSIGNLNALLGQLKAEQVLQATEMTELLLQEMGDYALETAIQTGTTNSTAMTFSYEDGKNVLNNLQDTMSAIGTTTSLLGDDIVGLESDTADVMTELIKGKFDITSASLERDVVTTTIDAFKAGEITDTRDISTYWNTDTMSKLSTFTRESAEASVVTMDDIEYTLGIGTDKIENMVSTISTVEKNEVTTMSTQTLLESLKQNVITETITEQKQSVLDVVASSVTQKDENVVLAENTKIETLLNSIKADIRRESQAATVVATTETTEVVEKRQTSLEAAIELGGKKEETIRAEAATVQETFAEIMRSVITESETPSEPKPTDGLMDAINQIRDEAQPKEVKEFIYETVGIKKPASQVKSLRIDNMSKKTKKGKNSDTSSEPRETVKVTVSGAVNKPGTYDIEIGMRMYYAITSEKAAQGFAPNADKDELFKTKVLDKIIDKNNTSINVPALKNKDKDDSSEQTVIYCVIEGAVVNSGIRKIEKGVTVSELIADAGGMLDGADRDKITVNGRIVGLNYILNDSDIVNVPEKTEEDIDNEKDTKRGFAPRYVEQVIENVCAECRKDRINPISLRDIQNNDKTADFVVGIIKKRIKDQKNIVIEDDELKRRLLKFVKDKLKIADTNIKSQVDNLANNMTIVRADQIPNEDMTIVVNMLMAQAERAKVLVSNAQKSTARRAQYIDGRTKIHTSTKEQAQMDVINKLLSASQI